MFDDIMSMCNDSILEHFQFFMSAARSPDEIKEFILTAGGFDLNANKPIENMKRLAFFSDMKKLIRGNRETIWRVLEEIENEPSLTPEHSEWVRSVISAVEI